MSGTKRVIDFPTSGAYDGYLLQDKMGGITSKVARGTVAEGLKAEGLAGSAELADQVDPAKGAALLGWKGRTVGERFDILGSGVFRVTDYMTAAQRAICEAGLCPTNSTTEALYDVSAAILLACVAAQNGGILEFPPGAYTLTQKASIAINISTNRGIRVVGNGAIIHWCGTVDTEAFAITASGSSDLRTGPVFAWEGLNIRNTGVLGVPGVGGSGWRSLVAGCVGLQATNATDFEFHWPKISGFDYGLGIRNDSTTAQNWSENVRIVRPHLRANNKACIRLDRIGLNLGNSMARMHIDNPVISGKTDCVFMEIGSGVSVYDSRIEHISGNFSGVAMFWIRDGFWGTGNMEGSVIDGFNIEPAGTNSVDGASHTFAVFKLDDEANTKMPVFMHRGAYAQIPAANQFVDGSNVPIPELTTPFIGNDNTYGPRTTTSTDSADMGFVSHSSKIFGQIYSNLVQDAWASLAAPTKGYKLDIVHGMFRIMVKMTNLADVSLQGFRGEWIVRRETVFGVVVIEEVSVSPNTEKVEVRWVDNTAPEIRVTGGVLNRGIRVFIETVI